MRKTNKKLTKQILTLMLAFVMVFTGMGIGSWGVDQAWADEDSFSKIAQINYVARGKLRNSFVVDHKTKTAVSEAKFESLVNRLSYLKLVDTEGNEILFDKITGTLDGKTVTNWTWSKDAPTPLQLAITIGGRTETYALSYEYKPDPTYFKTLL